MSWENFGWNHRINEKFVVLKDEATKEWRIFKRGCLSINDLLLFDLEVFANLAENPLCGSFQTEKEALQAAEKML
jgi:hypothetical protein